MNIVKEIIPLLSDSQLNEIKCLIKEIQRGPYADLSDFGIDDKMVKKLGWTESMFRVDEEVEYLNHSIYMRRLRVGQISQISRSQNECTDEWKGLVHYDNPYERYELMQEYDQGSLMIEIDEGILERDLDIDSERVIRNVMEEGVITIEDMTYGLIIKYEDMIKEAITVVKIMTYDE